MGCGFVWMGSLNRRLVRCIWDRISITHWRHRKVRRLRRSKRCHGLSAILGITIETYLLMLPLFIQNNKNKNNKNKNNKNKNNNNDNNNNNNNNNSHSNPPRVEDCGVWLYYNYSCMSCFCSVALQHQRLFWPVSHQFSDSQVHIFFTVNPTHVIFLKIMP